MIRTIPANRRPFMVLLCIICLSGCANRNQIQQKSIPELYQEAVSSASNRIFENHALTDAETVRRSYSDRTPVIQSAKHFEVPSSISAAPVITVAQWDNQSPARVAHAHLEVPSREDASVLDQEEGNYFRQPSPEAVARGQELPPPAQAGLQGPSEADLINEFFDQTDVREAIDIIAQTNGTSVIVDDTVGGVVTVEIKDATFEEALEKVLLPLGLVFAKHEGTYMIASPSPDSPLFSYIARRYHYEPRYHLASKLVELLPRRLSEYYQISDGRNLIVIDAPPATGEEILTRLQELDQPVPQVVLEAIVCVTSPDSGFRFGMDWNHVLALESANQLNVGLSGLALSASGSPYGVDHAFDDFAVTSAFVQLLSQQGYVTIRAAPRVTAKDGEKASISIARETFFSLQPSSSNVLFRQDVQQVDAGITLMITPRIRGNMVSIEIEKAEVSEDIRSNDSRPELTNNPYPIINRRQVSTQVDVANGQTIFTGGLVQRQTVDRINRIPFLGSLPAVGRFFRTVEKQEQDAEVAIFISPRIVDPVEAW